MPHISSFNTDLSTVRADQLLARCGLDPHIGTSSSLHQSPRAESTCENNNSHDWISTRVTYPVLLVKISKAGLGTRLGKELGPNSSIVNWEGKGKEVCVRKYFLKAVLNQTSIIIQQKNDKQSKCQRHQSNCNYLFRDTIDELMISFATS